MSTIADLLSSKDNGIVNDSESFCRISTPSKLDTFDGITDSITNVLLQIMMMMMIFFRRMIHT